MPKLDCFSPEKSENGLNFIPKFKIRTEFNPKIQNSDQIYPEKSKKWLGKLSKLPGDFSPPVVDERAVSDAVEPIKPSVEEPLL